MHLALYRKWRPGVFADVYGQEHITSVLKYEVAENKLSHAYLFCGSRGVGKTTCAKILAKAVNCENPVNGEPCGKCAACRAIENGTTTDVIEMDAASNNGVDNIRDIRDEVVFAPSQLKYRIYIVDEVHMLSQSAFNALLKTLEEPPSYVIFILATTEQHKLPATIISRCQRFEFRRISTDKLSQRLDLIAKNENINLTPDASRLIARLSQGGMRDAISLLELCAGSNAEITADLVNETVGSTGRERTAKIAEAVAKKNYEVILDEIAELVRSSKNISVFWQDMISFWRDMLIFRTTPDASQYLDLTDAETKQLESISGMFTRETLLWHSRLLDDAAARMIRSAATSRTTAELALIRMCDEKLDDRTDAILSRVAQLEKKIASGVPAQTVTAVPEEKPEDKKPVKAPEAKKPEPEKAAAPKAEAEPVKPVQQVNPVRPETPAPASPAKTEEKRPARVLKPLRCWAEVFEEIQTSDIILWLDVNTAKAYTDGGDNVVLMYESDFMLERANHPGVAEKTAEFISAQLGKPVRVTLEVKPDEKNGETDTIIDEIIENIENG